MVITKKILSTLTSIACTASAFAGMQFFIVNAETGGTYGDLTYSTIDSDDDGTYDYVEITDCNTSVTVLEIPSEIEGLPVTGIGKEALALCRELKSVTIPNSVTTIGEEAFYGCTSLESLEIPKGVTEIDDAAFRDCWKLNSITLPEGILSIGNNAFYNCNSLTGIIIPESAVDLGYKLLSWCTSLESVVLPSELTKITTYMFANCSGIESITIPETVTSIGADAFLNCTNLKSLNIPDGVSIIVENGENSVFDGCSSLADLDLSENNASYSIENGVLFNKDKTELIRCLEGKAETEYTIPDSISTIPKYSFFQCANLTKIIIPESVTSIEKSAFEDCSGLESIEIPDSVTRVESCAFADCTSLQAITIPASISVIENWLFSDCTGLTNVTIADGITSVGGCSFYGCTSLENITIPASVTLIDDAAFIECQSLVSVTIKNPECEIFDFEETFPESAEIQGYEGSTAQDYAEKYDRKFISLGEAPVVITVSDAVKLQKWLINADTLTEKEFTKYDLYDDGKLNVFDLIMIKRKIINT